MRHKDFERRDKVSKRDARVAEPLLVDLRVINKDKEVVEIALVVDLVLGRLSARHGEGGIVVSRDMVWWGSFRRDDGA